MKENLYVERLIELAFWLESEYGFTPTKEESEICSALREYADMLKSIDKAEPVAYIAPNGDLRRNCIANDEKEWGLKFTPLYTHPPKQGQSPIDERAEFEKALSEEMPMYQRQNYSADDVEANAKQVALAM